MAHRKEVWQPSLHDLLVAIHAPTQVWCAADGQIRSVGAQGVFHADVRVLSSAVVTVDGREPEPTMAASDGAGATVVGRAGPPAGCGRARTRRSGSTVVGRSPPAGSRNGCVVRNAGADPITTTVRVALGSDLAPIHVVKSGRAGTPAAARATVPGSGGTPTGSTWTSSRPTRRSTSPTRPGRRSRGP